MIPKELQERIQQEAEAYSERRFPYDLTDYGEGRKKGTNEGYFEGATAYAPYLERWQKAKDALEKIKNHPYPYMDPTDFGQMCDYIEAVRGMANQVLNSWKGEGNQEQNKTT